MVTSTRSENNANVWFLAFPKWILKVTIPKWSRIIIRSCWATFLTKFTKQPQTPNPHFSRIFYKRSAFLGPASQPWGAMPSPGAPATCHYSHVLINNSHVPINTIYYWGRHAKTTCDEMARGPWLAEKTRISFELKGNPGEIRIWGLGGLQGVIFQ